MSVQPIGYWQQQQRAGVYDPTRSDDQIRAVTQINNSLTRADGSVEVKQGNTTLLCTINCPQVAERAKQLEDKAFVEVNLHIAHPQPSTVSHELLLGLYDQNSYTTFLKEQLTQLASHVLDVSLYPRQKIVVSFEVIHHDGSLLAICANAFMQCVFNSGAPAKSTFLSFSLAKIEHNGEVHYKFDPTLADEAYAVGLLTMTIENLPFVHNLHTGESVDQTSQYITTLKKLQARPVADDSNQPTTNPLNKKYTADQIKEMRDKVEEEPQIVQLLAQKTWVPTDLQHAMGLIVEKWVVLAAEMRE